MKKFYFLLFIIVSINGISQNSIYMELGGVGGFASFNLEKPILKSFSEQTRFRLGLSFAPVDQNNGQVFIIPVLLHHSIGNDKHKLDLGIGQAISVTTKGDFFARAPLSIGYQIEPKDKHHFFRFAYTPIVSYLIDFQWEHWGGLSFGYKFIK